MTVNTTNITSGPFLGNGVNETFDFDFVITDDRELLVFETDESGNQVTLVLNTDYTITPSSTGGTVTRSDGPLPDNYTWYMRSNYDFTQLTSFESQGGFFPGVHEDAFDKLTYLLQQQNDQIGRTIRISDSNDAGEIDAIPELVASQLLRVNEGGTGFETINADTLVAGTSSVININGQISGLQNQLDNITDLTPVFTMNDLIAIDNPPANQMFNLTGFLSAGDQGGGLFYYDSTKPKSQHNGVTVIDPTKNTDLSTWDPVTQADWFQPTPAVAGNGCYVRINHTFIKSNAFGMIGDDGVTENTIPFNKLCAYVTDNKTVGIVTSASGKYHINQGAEWYEGTLIHEPNAIVRNTANAAVDFWLNTCLFIGSYFGFNSPSGINAETAYDCNNISKGDASFTLDSASDAANFPIGSVVYLIDASNYTNTEFAVACHTTEVIAVDGAVVSVRDNFPVAINEAGGTRVKARVATNSLPITGAVGRPSVTRLARNATLINGQYESERDSFAQVIHTSTFDCELNFTYMKGSELFGSNPSAYTKFTCSNGLYQRRGMELAYYHTHTDISDFKISRFDTPNPSTSVSVPFTISEYGNNTTGKNIIIDDENYTGDLNTSPFSILTPVNRFENVIINGTQNNGVGIGVGGTRAEDTVINGLTVNGSVNNGVEIASSDVRIYDVNVDNISPAARAVRISNESSNCVVSGGKLGQGQNSGSQYRVEVVGGLNRNNCVEKVNNHYSQHDLIDKTFSVHTGDGTDQVIKTYPVAAGTSTRNSEWCLEFIGNISNTSTVSAKTISVVAANITVATISLAANQTGFFSIKVLFFKGNANNRIDYRTSVDSIAGEIKTAGSITVNTATTDVDFDVIFNSAANSNLNSRMFKVTTDYDQIF